MYFMKVMILGVAQQEWLQRERRHCYWLVRVHLGLRYSRALHDVDVISGLAMTEKLDFLQFLIGLRI
jgi:hypothetical protein